MDRNRLWSKWTRGNRNLTAQRSRNQHRRFQLETLEPRLVLDSTVVFNEINYNPAGTDETTEWIELYNQMAVDIDLSGWRLDGGVDFSFAEGTVIGGGQYLVIAKLPAEMQAQLGFADALGPWLGSLNNNGERLQLVTNTDRVMNEVRYGDSGRWPVGPDGSGATLAKIERNSASDVAANWSTSAQVGGTPGVENFTEGPLLGETTTILSLDGAWRYDQSNTAPPATWIDSSFNPDDPDGDQNNQDAWLSGPGLFAFEDGALPAPVGTELNPGATTYYFRTEFEFIGNPDATQIALNVAFDDGAVVYLNGQEVLRLNMPSGPINHDTLASSSVGNAKLSDPFALSTNDLVQGMNVLAVEVHQANLNTVVPEPAGSVEINGGGLVLIEQGGTFAANNLAAASSGAIPFALDELAFNGTIHFIDDLNDGLYGNTDSWIGGGATGDSGPFAGINLGSTPIEIASIAFGRDNGGEGNVFTDRNLGTYELQYTTVSDPDEFLFDEDWTTIGTLDYQVADLDGNFTAPWLRHRYNFDPVMATGIRLMVPNTGLGGGTDIDEIELYAEHGGVVEPPPPPEAIDIFPEPGFEITWDGNNGDLFDPGFPAEVPDNLALATAGSTAFGSGQLFPDGGIHDIDNVIDGFYGNSNSWISNGAPAFIGVNFGSQIEVERIAWGRDNGNNQSDACGGQCADRSFGTYTLQFTTVADPDDGTISTGNAATGWQTIAEVDYNAESAEFTPYLRHEFSVSQDGLALSASGIRILVSDPGIAIDEIEVYGIDFFDVAFGAELMSTEILPDPSQSQLLINEVSPAALDGFWLELFNPESQPLNLQGHVLATTAAAGSEVVLPAITIPAGGYVQITQADLGFSMQDGEKLFLYSPGKVSVIDAVVVQDVLRGRSADHDRNWLYPDVATPAAENHFNFQEDIVINEIMFHQRPNFGTPDTPAQISSTTLIPISRTFPWRYDQSGTDWGDIWRDATFDDSDWRLGGTLMGFETAALPGPKSTPLSLGQTTYYFRTEFEFTGNIAETILQLHPVIDDGAVFYLNGQEVLRLGMPGGEIFFDTFSNRVVADAVFEGPFTISTDALIEGTNLLSVEVHQRSDDSSDVVFGTELLVVEEIAPAISGQPFSENNEEWVELFNRGNATVDLTDWAIRGGIDFDFTPGTTLAPGEFLVVAKDADALAIQYPDITIAGSFSGSLSNSSDRITLRDTNRNPADEVRYFDSKPWPEFADGGGSSLELRDPFADNSKPEAWAASDESSRSTWETYSYRGVAQSDFTPIRWNEFVFGLFGAGEILIDDLEVIEEPTGASLSLLRNGDFEFDTVGESPEDWRILGNHQTSFVDVDPDDPNNQVLRLISTGQTSDRQNHAETTFIDNRIAPNGRSYEIRFRAKWLGGSNLLNTRLYFNRLAARNVLIVPDNGGTPGAANSTLVENIGPTYQDLQHGPVVPNPNEPVIVSIMAADLQGIDTMTLWYKAGSGAWVDIGMNLVDGRYEGTILGQSASTIVQFYVQGTDALGAASTFPAAGRDARALFKVQDNQAQDGGLHNFRIIMTAADTSRLHDVTNVMSNQKTGATIIYNESEVFYDVGVRLKGSMAARPNSVFLGYNISFNADQLFRGVHDEVAIDRSGRGALVGNGQDEILVKQMMNHAGVIGSMYDDLIYVIAPRASENKTALLQLAEHRNIFLDEQFDSGSDGTLFNFDLIYYQRNAIGDPIEGLKTPVGYGHPPTRIEIQDIGGNKEDYRWNYRIKNNRDQDDFSRMIELAQTMNLTGSAFASVINEIADIDQWMQMYAMQSLAGVGGDLFTRGLPHNVRFYVRPEDQKVLAFPWDMDLSVFNLPSTASLWGTAQSSFRKIVEVVPAHTRIFYGYLDDMMNTTANREYLTPWVEMFSDLLPGQNFTGALSYVDNRASFVRSQLPNNVRFGITTLGPQDVGDASTVTLTGTGWVNVREMRIAGSDQPLDVTWNTVTGWETTIPVDNTTDTVSLEAYDFQGNLIDTTSITVISTAVRPILDQLRITELMFNPDGNDATEFIELTNISDTPIDSLAGVTFIDGIEFTFGDVSVAPGERILVVRDKIAFEAAHDTGLNIAGEYTGTALSNGGEQIILADSDGAVIQDFTYDDAWYPATDGDGSSLVIINAAAELSAWSEATGWRASFEDGGSPGTEDLMQGDINRDQRVGLADLIQLQGNLEIAAGATRDQGDLSGDGAINRDDFLLLAQNYGRRYDPPAPDPAPAPAASTSLTNHGFTTDFTQTPVLDLESNVNASEDVRMVVSETVMVSARIRLEKSAVDEVFTNEELTTGHESRRLRSVRRIRVIREFETEL